MSEREKEGVRGGERNKERGMKKIETRVRIAEGGRPLMVLDDEKGHLVFGDFW